MIRPYIGGSDAATICGVSKRETAYALWRRCRVALGLEDEETSARVRADEERRGADTAYTRLGRAIEDALLDEFFDGLALDFPVTETDRQAAFMDSQHPWRRGTLDAYGFSDSVNPKLFIVDAKTANLFMRKGWGADGTDQVPLEYLLQFQHYMSLPAPAGLTWTRTYVPTLLAGEFRVFVVERDNEIIAALVAKEIEFWSRVLSGDAPPITDATDAGVQWLRTRPAGSREADADILAWYEGWRAAKARAREAEEEAESFRGHILAACDGASAVFAPDGRKLGHWSEETRPSIGREELERLCAAAGEDAARWVRRKAVFRLAPGGRA